MKVAEKFETRILCSILFSENRAVYEKMWKKCRRAGKAKDNSTAHVHCMLDT